jgi:hypothetical protein
MFDLLLVNWLIRVERGGRFSGTQKRPHNPAAKHDDHYDDANTGRAVFDDDRRDDQADQVHHFDHRV